MAEDQTTKQQTEKLSYKLEDLSKKSTSELIEYNKKAQEKAEANRKEGLEKQSASLYGQNMNIAKQLKALGDKSDKKSMKQRAELTKQKEENDERRSQISLDLVKDAPNQTKMQLDALDQVISDNEERFKLQGKSRKDEKEMLKLEKKKFQLELKQASPSERKEMLKEQAAKDSRMLTTLQAIGQRIRGNEVSKDKGDSIFTGPLKFLKGILLKGALLAFIMFLPKILDSKVMRDAIDLFQNKILPGIKAFYKNVLVPLGEVLMDLFGDLLGTIGELFDNIGATVQKFKDGDILGGILGIFETIFDFLTGLLDNVLTALFNFFAKMFGFEETDSVIGSIKQFFIDLKDKVVTFFTETYDKVVSTISGIFTGITSFISEKITAVIDYLKGIFGFDGEGFTFASLFDIVYAPVNLAVNLIKDIFSLGDPDTPFRLSEFIGGIFTKIGDFFRNLFDIDVRALASKFLPKKLVDFVLGKDEEEAENLAAAEESGFYTKRGIGRDSRIDQGLVPFAPEGQLKAILADDDLADEDKEMIEKELQKRQLQKDLRKGGLGVPEQIDDFGGTDRAMREAAAREAQSTNIVSSDNSVRNNSSNTIVQSETITPTYSGYSMVTAESDY